MDYLVRCAEAVWRRALEDLGGEVVACDLTPDGLEMRARFGKGQAARAFVARWFIDAGVLCEGERSDIVEFNEACARRGFVFRLDQMALCG